jgi:hypothetical protein
MAGAALRVAGAESVAVALGGRNFHLFFFFTLRPCLVRKNFQDSSSYRIFGRMHEVLNIDKNKN